MQCAVALQQEGPEFEDLLVSLDVLPLCSFSTGTQSKDMQYIGENISLSGCLALYASPVIDWWKTTSFSFNLAEVFLFIPY